MVCCCLSMLDVQQVAQGGPQGGGELGSAVQCDDRWDPESAHPPLKQSIGAVDSCGTGDGYGLWPAGSSVYDCEQMSKTF
jgi:hypothetical protein